MFRFCVSTMVIWRMRFNFIFVLMAAVVLACGCESTGRNQKKLSATLRVHMEVDPRTNPDSEPAPIYRADPFLVTVAKQPFLTEAFVKRASVVQTTGGFALLIEYDTRGALLLEQQTGMNPGRHLAINSAFGPKLATIRWLAAPLVNHRVSNGQLGFTPDCTLEEAQQIAAGLNNVVKQGKSIFDDKQQKP